jgi:uncharacterized protein YabN with tetrapyrrole methylase and pyrophosphatase domain
MSSASPPKGRSDQANYPVLKESATRSEHRSRLIVVGTGIRTTGQLTTEAMAWMRASDVLLYIVSDPVAELVIRQLNPRGARSLEQCYVEGKLRTETYEEMIEQVLHCTRQNRLTCLACYGHPGVYVYPSHEAIRRARAEGLSATMLPGISAEDCLFSDLGIDPAENGCQSYEATDFLLNDRTVDTSASLILWQVGVVGVQRFSEVGYFLPTLPLLTDKLCAIYAPSHSIYLYEAAIYPGCEPSIQRVDLCELTRTRVAPGVTAYLPPARRRVLDRDVLERLAVVDANLFATIQPNVSR